MRKTVIKHLKEDIKESKESICEDRELLRKLRAPTKKHSKKQRRPRLWD
jgi:peptidoglycan hydrolase CwlO-like protein